MLCRIARRHANAPRWLKDPCFFFTATNATNNSTPSDSVVPIQCIPSMICEGGEALLRLTGVIQTRRYHAALRPHQIWNERLSAVETLNTPYDYRRALGRYWRNANYSRMFDLFEQMKARNIERDSRVYLTIIKAYTRTNNTEMAIRVFNEFISTGMIPDKLIVNALIYVHTKTGDVEAAYEIFQKMKNEYRIKPDPVTYRLLLIVCGKGKNMNSAKAMFDTLVEKMEDRDVRNYNFMLQAYCDSITEETADTYVREAKDLVKTMEKKGIKPNGHTYTQLVKLFSKTGYVADAMSYFTQASNGDMELRVTSFDSLIESVGNLALTDEENEAKLLECFKLMKEYRLRPSFMTYVAVVDVFEKRGDVSKAFDFFDKLLDQFNPNAAISSARLECIERLYKSEVYDKQQSLMKLEEALEKARKSVSLTYNGHELWLSICIRASDVERAFACWNNLTQGYGRPSLDMTKSMLRLVLDHDRIDDALQILEFVQKEKNLRPPKEIYALILAHCAERNDQKNAKQVFKLMKEEKVEPDEAIQKHLDDLELI